MLPRGLGKYFDVVRDPLISGFFTTRRTESGLTGMGYPDAMLTLWTGISVVPQPIRFTDQHFDDVEDNGEAQ